jgi:hypothetical protein
LGGDWAWRSTRFGSSVPKTAGADKPPSWIAPGVVHPAPTEPRPASHPVIGRTVGDPLARRGHSAHRLRADDAHTPWTSQHVSVVSLQVLQAMLAGDIARWSAPRATTTPTDSTTARQRGRPGDPGRPPGADPRTLVRFGSVPPWSSGDPRRARAVTTSTKKGQVTTPSCPEPRLLGHGRRGFESHVTPAAGRRPLPTRQARRSRASPCGRADGHSARLPRTSSSLAVPLACHSHRS